MASSLNVMCSICTEFYTVNDKVYSTVVCGHLFHSHCLTRWLEHNNNCPHCRKVCLKSRVHRVFLNFGERTALDDNMPEYDGPTWIPLDWTETDGYPEGAIKAGIDEDGNDALVARVYYDDEILLPANYVPKKKGAYTPYGCNAHFTRNTVELLVDCNVEWVADRNGHVPPNAIITGYESNGEKLYTGRATYEGILLPGKIHPSHGVLYMPHKTKEVNTKEYEVLVHIPKVKEETKEEKPAE